MLRRADEPGARRANKIDASRTSRSPPSSIASGSATRSPSPPPRASAPATCWTDRRAAARGRGRGRGGRNRRLAVIGRPNVGKSSLVNSFLGADRVIVCDVAGTTRDAIDLPLEVDGRPVILVDTAGLRRQAKVSEDVEYYTALRSQRAAERADVAIVVCDAADGVTAQDLRVAELAMKASCATASCSTSGTSPRWTRTTSTTSAPSSRRSCACGPRC